jgi:energy-coupling factor transporter ATP-binding protein EcfA2
MTPTFRASKSRSQGKEGWCILFHHPLRRDPRGENPKRIRRGLGTRDDGEADRLVEQMNRLLSDESYWTLAARDRALREIDQHIVSIFYDDIAAKIVDPWVLREEVLPLPGRDAGYTRVLFVGPTGAGKTTLVRQLIGSDPKRDRFPSTSTAKTTVFDTEIITSLGQYQAVVSFLSFDRVRYYLEECLAAAVSAAAEGLGEDEIARRLLEHSEQRFRLKYLLGDLRLLAQADADDGDDEEGDRDESEAEEAEEAPAPETVELTGEERRRLEEQLRLYLNRVADIAASVRGDLASHLGENLEAMKAADRDAFLELVEEKLRENEEAQSLIDDILDDIKSRFDLVEHGEMEKDLSGWATRWVFETGDRTTFIRAVNRFSSNYAPNFGRLLTPLVQGLRVAGPFRPEWLKEEESIRLVLMDGEGLGHTPDSASSLPTAITKRYENSDVILLVDNSTQPMVAGALTVLRSVSASGHESKLVVVFTHFDRMKGDNLPNEQAKRNHVRASLENGINGVDSALGSGAGRSLRRHLAGKVFYMGRIDEVLPRQRRSTRTQLGDLVKVFMVAITPPPPTKAVPLYDLANLVLGATTAARQFQDAWGARLPVEHWTRVKALTRRLGYLDEDQYDSLRPVANLIDALQEQARILILAPRAWESADPPEEMRRAAVDNVSREFFSRLHAFVSERLWIAHHREWQTSYDRSGRGSGNLRKSDVRAIHNVAAPVPGVAPTNDAVEFLDAVRALFKDACAAAGAKIV